MGNKHVNAIVVGAGAGGGIVAKELSVAGLSVVLFERGGWATFDDTDTDELRSQRTTVLGAAYGPDDQHSLGVVRGAGDAAGRGRALRRAGLHGVATDARDRRAHGAGR